MSLFQGPQNAQVLRRHARKHSRRSRRACTHEAIFSQSVRSCAFVGGVGAFVDAAARAAAESELVCCVPMDAAVATAVATGVGAGAGSDGWLRAPSRWP